MTLKTPAEVARRVASARRIARSLKRRYDLVYAAALRGDDNAMQALLLVAASDGYVEGVRK